jgi:hypothetical protein
VVTDANASIQPIFSSTVLFSISLPHTTNSFVLHYLQLPEHPGLGSTIRALSAACSRVSQIVDSLSLMPGSIVVATSSKPMRVDADGWRDAPGYAVIGLWQDVAYGALANRSLSPVPDSPERSQFAHSFLLPDGLRIYVLYVLHIPDNVSRLYGSLACTDIRFLGNT